jgi:hypothetical protein
VWWYQEKDTLCGAHAINMSASSEELMDFLNRAATELGGLHTVNLSKVLPMDSPL